MPLSRLADYALPRPRALAAVLDALGRDGFAVVGGGRGVGKSTFVHQVAAALRVRTVVVSSAGLLINDEDGHRRSLATELIGPGEAETAAWEALRPKLTGQDLLVFDGLDARQLEWARVVPQRVGARLLCVAPEGIEPDPIDPDAGASFLESRSRRAGVTWTAAALAKAVAFVDGSPAMLQRVGESCVAAALEQSRRRIDLDTFLDGAHRAATELPAWMAQRIEGLDGPRRALAKAIARHGAETPSEWARRCGLEPKAAVVHLQRMVEQGLLRRSGRGQYEMVPVLGLHLQANYGSLVHVFQASGRNG